VNVDGASTVLAKLSTAEVRRRPFRWALIDDMLGEADGRALAAEFPADGYREAGTRGTDYSFYYRDLISDGAPAADWRDCSPRWRRLGELLLSDAYRSAMSAVMGVSLDALTVSAGFCLYPAGAQLRPHPDQPIRVVTQTIYFNDPWEPLWGGSLLLLRSANLHDVEEEVAPTLGRSVVFVRSDHSWHAVTRVRRGVDAVRKSVLLHYSR
jgi:SM-20-related protein